MDLNDKRIRALTALLRTRYDYFPAPRGCLSGVLVTRSVSKTTATEQVPCPTCSGRGTQSKSKCERCQGSGRVLVDPYTGEDDLSKGADTQAIGSGESRSRAHRRLEAALAKLEGSGGSELGPTLSALLRREAAGSYRELEQALEALRRDSLWDFRLVVSVYCEDEHPYFELDALSDWDMLRLLGSLDYLSSLMPKQIRVPKDVEDWDEARRAASALGRGRWANGSAQVRRNEDMRSLNVAGWSVGELALRFGVSKSQVRRVLGRKVA